MLFRQSYMPTYYPKRALEILSQDGPVELFKSSTRFILRQLDPKHHHRFRFHTWKNHLQNCARYDAPPDPYKTIEIRPSEIKHRVGRNKTLDGNKRPLRKVKEKGLARTKSGEWDSPPHRLNVEETYIVKGMIQRFGAGMEWDKTEYYKRIFEKYSKTNQHKQKGFDDLQNYMQKRCESYDDLFESIENKGYISGHNGSRLEPNRTQPIRDQLEVLVVIDRDGEVCFFEGNHRFGIARVLDIEIPAHVVCRHKQWQELRDEIHNNGLPEDREDLRNHPDLQDILD